MDQNLLSFFIGIIAGLIASSLIVWYVHSENSRKDLNLHIDFLFNEIDFNRTKLPKYDGFFKSVKNQWEQDGTLNWINHNEISIGYGGFLYNFFKFDAYNLFTNKGFNLYFEPKLDFKLKLFYYNCKMFCAATQAIENNIHKSYQEEMINLEWNKIESEYNGVVNKFNENLFFSLENVNKFKINWVTWHIKRIRMINPEREETYLSIILNKVFPFGWYSVSLWFMIIFGLGLMVIGALLIQAYVTVSQAGSGAFNTWIGPFLTSLGFAFIVYAVSVMNQLTNRKRSDEIIAGIKKIVDILETTR